MTAQNRSSARKPLTARIVTGVVFIAAVLAVFAYASPYFVLSRLRDAIHERDTATINRYVDYPALRASLKVEVTQMLSRRVDAEKLQHPLTALGALVGMAFVNPLVDAYATPDGVAALLKGMPPRGEPGEAPPPVGEPQPDQGQGAPAAAASSPVQAPEPRAKANAGYRDIDTFAVSYSRDTGGVPYSVIFHRRGWFTWQIDAVQLNP
ncbi:hypothetical protein C0Z18_18780 [Trinickia dabaoshanensis]|uniref:DUF2939 domain-containing protein n=1 Tax=Trinickia dabaoshanensis TaxID=564714 RepID=A0A2N7VLC6_9BURK|nr:DUF2939 domain-containing protein [Trinickia dabaoshanensis]PMS17960.1 hypothetical protein C0Z18_18780 [Trinickia dabaoshanensis]